MVQETLKQRIKEINISITNWGLSEDAIEYLRYLWRCVAETIGTCISNWSLVITWTEYVTQSFGLTISYDSCFVVLLLVIICKCCLNLDNYKGIFLI